MRWEGVAQVLEGGRGDGMPTSWLSRVQGEEQKLWVQHTRLRATALLEVIFPLPGKGWRRFGSWYCNPL